MTGEGRGGTYGGVPQKKSRRQLVKEEKTMKCQKCLQIGHWTYECKATERAYVQKESYSRELESGKEKVPESALPPGEEQTLNAAALVAMQKGKRKNQKRQPRDPPGTWYAAMGGSHQARFPGPGAPGYI